MASTTLRYACMGDLNQNCRHLTNSVKKRADPYGYRNPKELYHAVSECPKVNHFCVQGGDAEMSVINYNGEEGGGEAGGGGDDDNSSAKDDEAGEDNKSITNSKSITNNIANMSPMHFIHLVPFRNFEEWG